MAELASRQRIHLLADGNPPEPEVHRPDGARRNLWRVDVPVGSEGEAALPGSTAIRSHPEELLSEIDPDVDLRGYRPEWLDLLYVPRLLPSRRREPLRRLSGGLIQPDLVFGNDNRTELAETSYPWGNVGIVFTSEGGVGAGALVGNRLVATAGHVVPWRDIAAGNWWMRFVPAYYNGQSLHGAGVESFVSDIRGYNPGTGADYEAAGYDWAVCRLYEPLGATDRLGHFGVNGYNPDWNSQPWWTHMGYPQGMWFVGASLQGGIAIFDDDSDSNGGVELEHRGDTSGGNSGGPMFAFWGSDPRLIGVQAGSEEDVVVFPPGTELGNVAAGGPGFSNLVAWGRTNWP
ncbi:hypothetical protein FHS41_007482 [Streptomyces violarus]|uniref:Serine protease n=1 Tax=Streptomyces violarus TaxID=67380 RepID=A0A7W5F5S5_9ACTN|nr:hypothetical protein [Streptomyces violarus]MBB3080928.1 hypothetical protein [Streptomyces violarus]